MTEKKLWYSHWWLTGRSTREWSHVPCMEEEIHLPNQFERGHVGWICIKPLSKAMLELHPWGGEKKYPQFFSKKGPRKSRKTPHVFGLWTCIFPEENLGKNEVKFEPCCKPFILYIIYINTWFWVSFFVSPFSLCMVSCKSKMCMIIAYLVSSTQMFQ